jgi:hypothetical protein
LVLDERKQTDQVSKALELVSFRFLNIKSENFLLTFCPLTPSLSPVGERGRVRGNSKYFWLDFIVSCHGLRKKGVRR